MIFAAIGDINGNFSALDAVLGHLEEEGIHTVFQTGNLVVGALEGDEVVAALREINAHCVQGIRDRQLARLEKKRGGLAQRLDAAEFENLERAAAACGFECLEYLRDLPHKREIILENITICLCHGSPSSQQKILDADSPPLRFEREREIANAQLLILGGAEEAFHHWVADTLTLCPGVCDKGDGQAHFTLVNTEESPWVVEEFSVEIE